jgi:hypothetical protein
MKRRLSQARPIPRVRTLPCPLPRRAATAKSAQRAPNLAHVVLAAHLRPRDVARAFAPRPEPLPFTPTRTPGSAPARPSAARGARGWPRSPRSGAVNARSEAALAPQSRSVSVARAGDNLGWRRSYGCATVPSGSAAPEAFGRGAVRFCGAAAAVEEHGPACGRAVHAVC